MNNQDGKSIEQSLVKHRRKKLIRNIIWAFIILGYLFILFVSFPQFDDFYIVPVILFFFLGNVIMMFLDLRDQGYGIGSSLIHCFFWSLLGVFILAMFIPLVWGRGEFGHWENRCKLTLRALGSTQITFAEKNNDNYGDWQELTDADFIQEGYNRLNMIDNYSIVVFERKKATLCNLAEGTTNSSFTIIAIPRSERTMQKKIPIHFFPRKGFPGVNVIFRNHTSYYFRRFAICEDQNLRFWVGIDSQWTTENISLRNEELWKPLR